MASPGGKAGNSIVVSLDGVQDVITALSALPKDIAKKYLMSGLNRAIKPTKQALQNNVAGIGKVTGNLARAVTSRSVLYPSGTAVAVVGFRRAGKAAFKKGKGSVRSGPDRAFHSHLIEFGTKSRKPLNALGRQLQKTAAGRRSRAAYEKDGLGYTLKRDFGIMSSGSQRGFFSRPDGKTNFMVTISPRGLTEIRGGPALHPMARAFAATRVQVTSALEREMAKALELAVKANAKRGGPSAGGAD
jgi:hypothetical protein